MIRKSIILGTSAIAFAAADKGGSATPPATPPAPPAAATKEPEVKVLGIRTDIARPEGARKSGAKSKYDFDALEVGQSFGVIGKTAKSFNSIIYAAEQRLGEKVKNPDGTEKMRVKKNKDGSTELVNEINKVREFTAYDVDPKTDPEGATVRVFRDK
jgi:hypothetical protein